MNYTINYSGPINDDFVNQVRHAIDSFPETPESLCLNISSNGGSTSSGIAAYNILKQLPYPLKCHNLGEVSSAAILPYLAGKERTAESISKFMIHPAEIEIHGSIPFFKVEETLSIIAKDIENYAAIVNREIPNFSEHYNVVELLKHQSLVLSPADAHAVGIVTAI